MMHMLHYLLRLRSEHKLTIDLTWTFGSFLALALSGLCLNLIIVYTRDVAALGLFSITYALYLVGAQIALFGIHNSVLRHTAYVKEDNTETARMISTAVVISLGSGCVFAGMLFLLSSSLSLTVFNNADLASLTTNAAFGLTLFPLNKTLMAHINGLRHMKAFSLLQGLRYVTVCVVGGAISYSSYDYSSIALAFLVSEVAVTCCIMIYFLRNRLVQHFRFSLVWARKHLIFGSQCALGSILIDVNARLDTLVLGTMLSPREVGVYSFAATIIDGVHQILAVIRLNFNPLLVSFLRNKEYQSAVNLLAASKRYVFVTILVLSILLVGGYMILINTFVGRELETGLTSLLILTAGFTLLSPLIPFDNLMMMSGHPTHQTLQTSITSTVNVMVCLSLVPILGIEGAALGSVMSYFAGYLFLIYASAHLLGWNLVTNKFTFYGRASAPGD